MIPLPRTSSPSPLRSPLVRPCEPLCARLGAGVACVPDEGCFAHARRTLRRYKNGKYAAVTRGRPAFQQHETNAEGSDTTPMQERRKSAVCREKNSLKASRRNILFLCRRWEIPLRKLLFPIGAEVSFYGSLITSVGGGQHRICLVCGKAAALPNAPDGAWPHTPFPGGSPHPLKAASVSAETLLPASGGAASKGDQSPFEEPPALRGDERNHFRKVIDYEKRYQIQHAHGIHRP